MPMLILERKALFSNRPTLPKVTQHRDTQHRDTQLKDMRRDTLRDTLRGTLRDMLMASSKDRSPSTIDPQPIMLCSNSQKRNVYRHVSWNSMRRSFLH